MCSIPSSPSEYGEWKAISIYGQMIEEINSIIASVLRRKSLDWRTCYTSVYPSEPDGSTVVVEASDRGVLAEAEERVRELGALGVGRVSFVLLPDESSELPSVLVAAASVVDLRKAPSHTSELLTQVVYGDEVEPLKGEGDWLLVRLDDGYIGWMRNWNLKWLSEESIRVFDLSAGHRVADNVIQIYEEPSYQSLPLCDAVVGTPVVVRSCRKRGWREVELADGKRGYTRSSTLERRAPKRSPLRERLSATGLRFLGIPYIWGGTTPKGFDCSGLIQRIFRLNGYLLPRDADMQSRFGKPRRIASADELRTGDLLFFGKGSEAVTHVAMYLSNRLFLHAYGEVRVGSIDPRHPLFEGKLTRDWRLTRDPLVS